MTKPSTYKPDPKLDLVLERTLAVPRELVWTAWTTPKHIRHWFVPKPWTITDCEIDLRPGGVFRSVMRSPEGQEFPNVGCYLEIVPNERLVFTDTLLPGYRPSENPFFTAILSLESQGSGTRYTAIALHRDEAGRKKHERDGLPRRMGHRRRPDGGVHHGGDALSRAAHAARPIARDRSCDQGEFPVRSRRIPCSEAANSLFVRQGIWRRRPIFPW